MGGSMKKQLFSITLFCALAFTPLIFAFSADNGDTRETKEVANSGHHGGGHAGWYGGGHNWYGGGHRWHGGYSNENDWRYENGDEYNSYAKYEGVWFADDKGIGIGLTPGYDSPYSDYYNYLNDPDYTYTYPPSDGNTYVDALDEDGNNENPEEDIGETIPLND